MKSQVLLNLAEMFQSYSTKYMAITLKVIFIVLCIWLLKVVTIKLTQKLFTPRKGAKNFEKKWERIKTLLPLLISIERYLIYFIGVMAILSAVGIDTKAIIASAGVLGVAIGFGAQNTVKDFIAGFFLIFDGLVKVGDVLTIGEITGEVERIDLRNTMIREFPGKLWAIPNGDMRSIGNFNRGWVRAIVEVGVAYEQPLEQSMKILEEVATEWAETNRDIILEGPEVQGVNNLGDSSVVIRIVIKLKPLKHWSAERELKRMIKNQFDQKGIEIPFPRRVVYNK